LAARKPGIPGGEAGGQSVLKMSQQQAASSTLNVVGCLHKSTEPLESAHPQDAEPQVGQHFSAWPKNNRQRVCDSLPGRSQYWRGTNEDDELELDEDEELERDEEELDQYDDELERDDELDGETLELDAETLELDCDADESELEEAADEEDDWLDWDEVELELDKEELELESDEEEEPESDDDELPLDMATPPCSGSHHPLGLPSLSR
jgi:hypothetical protein